ncbi:MAG: hypothetical protein RIS36_673 [Pseudomonadota bacterium]|jgi:hypothetical protein
MVPASSVAASLVPSLEEVIEVHDVKPAPVCSVQVAPLS